MIYFILIIYILPMVVNGIYVYKDQDIKTIRDFVEHIWILITPFLNLLLMCIIILNPIFDLLENRFNIKTIWKELMDKKIK